MSFPIHSRVRSRRDGAIGHVLQQHQESPRDPVVVLVRWNDDTHATWYRTEHLELCPAPSTDVEAARELDPESLLINLGDKIAALRAERGEPQRVFAPSIGLTHAALADLETGRRDISLTKFFALCLALNMDPSTLLDWPRDTADKK